MFLRILVLSFVIAVQLSFQGMAQTTTSDPQAVAVLTQALTVSGAGSVASPGQGFTANGTITYFWAGQRVQGPATIRARGHDQFRVDANLPEGTRTVSVNRHAGSRKDADGKSTGIPFHNTVSMGGKTFPYSSLVFALSEPTVTLTYVGLVENGNQQLHQVRAIRNFLNDPEGIMAKLSETDLFVDTKTNLVVKIADATHPIETSTVSFPRETEFEGYKGFGGVAVPTTVREKINRQTMWELNLTGINFTGNLADADFTLP